MQAYYDTYTDGKFNANHLDTLSGKLELIISAKESVDSQNASPGSKPVAASEPAPETIDAFLAKSGNSTNCISFDDYVNHITKTK